MNKFLFAALLMASLFSGCSSFVEGYETSPNSPTEVTLPLLMAQIQVSTFSSYSGQNARTASMWIQTQTGVQFQSGEVGNYALFEGDVTNEWENFYTNGLNEAKTLIELAGDENPAYRGIARILMAMNLGLLTDLWGNVPYREALQGLTGEAGFNPAYQSQETIYQDIQSLLTDAIADLGATENKILPMSDDYIFNGDIDRWIRTAHILKARYAIHLTKKDASAASNALGHIDAAFAAGLASSADDCNAIFGENGNELNQWYAFNITRANYIKMGEFFINLLQNIDGNGLVDPRLPFYAELDGGGAYTGAAAGSSNEDASNIGTYFGSATSVAPMVSYVEAKFIEAEAAFRANNPTRAAEAHNAAIMAHIEQVTGAPTPADYMLSQASETNATITLDKIMTHKYIAMFTQVESWTDWRRTGIPTIAPNPSGLVNAIPRRFPTPQTERQYNTNAEIVTDILQPVWWDN